MDTADILKIIELAITFIGVIAAIFGVLIPHVCNKKQARKALEIENKLLTIKWEKEFVDRQLAELFGPVRALLMENSVRYEFVCKQLGNEHIFQNGVKLSDEQRDLWSHYVNEYCLPCLRGIVQILKDKLHLLELSIMESCVANFITYATHWDMLASQADVGANNNYNLHSTTNFPTEFSDFIYKRYDELVEEQHNLKEQIATLNKR